MSARIIPLGCITRLDLPVDRVLEGAKSNLSSVVIMGWDTNDELYFASTFADGGEILWLMEKCKEALLNI